MPALKRKASSGGIVLDDVRARLCAYARHALGDADRSSHRSTIVARWVGQNARRLNLNLPSKVLTIWSDLDDDQRPTSPDLHILNEALGSVRSPSPKQRPFAALARTLGLDVIEEGILTLASDYRTISPVESLWDRLASSEAEPPNLTINSSSFAVMLGVSQHAVRTRLRSNASLRSSGLVFVEGSGVLAVLPRLHPFVSDPFSARDLRSALLGPAAHAPLDFPAFEHLGDSAVHVRALLRGAIQERAQGVHVLLYGPPGTGKTAFAAALAAEAGVPIFDIGLEGIDGEELSRGDRLAQLRLSQRLVSTGEPAMLLMDEAEDLFDAAPSPFSGATRAGSRAYMHRLLETSPVPVIWTANDIGSLGPAVLRRMSCCIELRIPPARVRERLWQNAARAEGIVLPEGEAKALSHLLAAAPALASSAMRAARLAGGDPSTVRWAVAGVARAMGGGRLPSFNGAEEHFDPALINADINLTCLAERLAAPGAKRQISLLLSGPPGSGKSAYARHLAERMGMPILQRRGSDLIGPYVGETEQRIASAFQEARDADAFLIFDEADSLLRDRALSSRGWEVSQVNEMLTWMECHPLPFCCTTNLVELLDAAAMRRFLIKARLNYLSAFQAARAWQSTFGLVVPANLELLDRLTPADFEVVRRGAELEGGLNSAKALFQALQREQMAKPGARSAIGFNVAA